MTRLLGKHACHWQEHQEPRVPRPLTGSKLSAVCHWILRLPSSGCSGPFKQALIVGHSIVGNVTWAAGKVNQMREFLAMGRAAVAKLDNVMYGQ
jgi:hypothetical protein